MKKPTSKGRTTRDGMQIIDRLTGADPARREGIAEARLELAVAQVVYDARTQAGLTQAQLARKLGTTQSAVSRLEDAEYGGHSLTMLRRIARALDLQLHISLVPRAKDGRGR